MECGLSHHRLPHLVTTFTNPPGCRHGVQEDAIPSMSPASPRAHTPPASTAPRSVHRSGRLYASILPFTRWKNEVFPFPRLFASHKSTNARRLQVGRSDSVDEAGLGEEVRLHVPGLQAPLNQGDEASAIVRVVSYDLQRNGLLVSNLLSCESSPHPPHCPPTPEDGRRGGWW